MRLQNVTIQEFENKLYSEYIKIFPKEEQRDWKNIKKTYEKGIEKFYIIVEEEVVVGFIMLEKNEKYESYYIDYFAILEEYRNKGIGTKALQLLLENVVKDNLLFLEIEKPVETNVETIKRKKFYINLGFKEIESEYLLYKVLYKPFVYSKKYISKEKIDIIMFDYYIINCGKEAVKANCRIIK